MLKYNIGLVEGANMPLQGLILNLGKPLLIRVYFWWVSKLSMILFFKLSMMWDF